MFVILVSKASNRNRVVSNITEPKLRRYDNYSTCRRFQGILDPNFPVDILTNVEQLEWTIRKDLEFKFLLVIQLNCSVDSSS